MNQSGARLPACRRKTFKRQARCLPHKKTVPERACKPGSVPRASKWPAREDGHFSRTPVARRLQQPTRALWGPDRPARPGWGAGALLGLAPGGVCRASRVTPAAGALLPHRFTLTAAARRRGPNRRPRRSAFCCTFPGLAAGRCCRPPCPVEPGLASPGFHQQRPSGPLRDHWNDIAMVATWIDAL